MQKTQITIIGGGFCGIMTAVHLLQDHRAAFDLHIVNKGNPLAKGVAYNPHTPGLLLNVPNGKISAFDDQPDHFADWLVNDKPQLTGMSNLGDMFATRQQYGRYLAGVWSGALNNMPADVTVTTYDDEAYDIAKDGDRFRVFLRQHEAITTDLLVLATGNVVPQLPKGLKALANSKRYFGNPWRKDSIENLDPKADVLIAGNGLTMVDTVIGMVEKGFNGKIYTVSPNGYQLKPSTETKPAYRGADPKQLMKNSPSLLNIVKYLNKHRKKAWHADQSFFKVIDDLRPYNQQIWRSLSIAEKKQFAKHFATMWNTARHRLPVSMFDLMQKLQTEKRLVTLKGQITTVIETNNKALVTVNCSGETKIIGVQRVINCTGPGSDLKLSPNELLRNISTNGLICPDALGMGINADQENGMVINAGGELIPNLFVVGTNLKGTLFESTAVPELRAQAEKLSRYLSEKCHFQRYHQQMI